MITYNTDVYRTKTSVVCSQATRPHGFMSDFLQQLKILQES